MHNLIFLYQEPTQLFSGRFGDYIILQYVFFFCTVQLYNIFLNVLSVQLYNMLSSVQLYDIFFIIFQTIVLDIFSLQLHDMTCFLCTV